MQLRKMTLMLAVLGSMSMVLTGCPDGGRDSLTCAADTDCIEGEICHPGAKVCVQTCTSGADCPESSKTCDVISSTNSTKVCQCSTDALCQRDERISDASGLTCSTTYKVCTGGTTAGCTKDSDCGTGQTCNTSTGTCSAATTTCSGEGQSTCAYGQFCSGTTCTAVPAPTCANFDPAQGGRAPTFNAATSTGPIIYDITQVSFAQDSFCAETAGSTGLTAKARVKAYIRTGTFPAEKSGLPGLFYVRVNGTQVDGTTLIRPSEYTTADAGKRAEFTMNFCPGSTATTLSIGLYFTGGNEICKQLNR